jgi:transcriptional regulator with XRE-family HTH domain
MVPQIVLTVHTLGDRFSFLGQYQTPPSGPPDGLRFSASKTFTSPIVSGASAECVPSLALSMSRRKRPASQTSRASARASSAAETSEFASQLNVRLAESVRGILATRNLTLYKVAARSRSDYPGRPRYHLPANLYFRLRSGNWTPTLYQLSVLSKMSEYHLADWLSVFGFPPDAISRVEATLRRPRTVLLDSTVYDPRATIPWFRERQAKRAIASVAALSEILEPSGSRQLSSLLPADPPKYVYAKIGMQDALAFPELLPGSIVRVNPRLATPIVRRTNGATANSIFLVEHQGGYCCCRLHYEEIDRITLLPTQLPFANVEFRLGIQARIIGAVDVEFRLLVDPETTRTPRCSLPEIAPALARLWTPTPFRAITSDRQFITLLRTARLRAGLSFHDASELSRSVAKVLGDKRYFTSQASLSDYEARNSLPRHIHKLFTLCAIYAIPFSELLDSFGLSLQKGGTVPIPDQWMPQSGLFAEVKPELDVRSPGFLDRLLAEYGTLPFFLRDSLASLLGLSELSLHDVFWARGQTAALHPALTGALFIAVNRKRRTPPAFLRKSLWDRPLYLLARRNGSHVLASCTLQDQLIVFHSHAGNFVRPERLQNHADAEIVGQIVGVVRALHPPT